MQIIKPTKPVGELTIEVVREIKKISNELQIELLLVGAQAKVILLQNIFGLDPGRATDDIDFAFAVENWEEYDQIKQRLISAGNFRALPKAAQRLLYKSNLTESEFVVDLIPFGSVQDEKNMIAWPPNMDIVMNVSGYQETLASSLLVEIAPKLIVNVVSLPGLAILKIFAWSDRGNTTENKDAVDLLTLLRTYHSAGNIDRVYDETDVLESFNYEPELAGAWLLGRDVAEIANESTIKTMMTLLKQKSENLITQMAKSLTTNEDALGYAEQLLTAYIKGLKQNTE